MTHTRKRTCPHSPTAARFLIGRCPIQSRIYFGSDGCCTDGYRTIRRRKDGGRIPTSRACWHRQAAQLYAQNCCAARHQTCAGSCGSAKEPGSAHGSKNLARCAVSSRRSFAACHGRRGHAEHAARTDCTFPVGIPSAQQCVSAESRWDCFERHSGKNGRPKTAAQRQSANRQRRKIVSQYQRTGADGTGRVCTTAQHLCAAA